MTKNDNFISHQDQKMVHDRESIANGNLKPFKGFKAVQNKLDTVIHHSPQKSWKIGPVLEISEQQTVGFWIKAANTCYIRLYVAEKTKRIITC